jgi:D-aspartate ligase
MRAPAVVVGIDSITGLQSARILARHGIPVFGVAGDVTHFCCRTRVCRAIVPARTSGDELIDALESLTSRLGEKAVLVPCTDASVLAISRGRARLAESYHVALPHHAVVEVLIDKAKFAEHAHERGLPIPQTLTLRSRADAEEAAATLQFPCMVKPPIKAPLWEERASEKAYKAETAAQLLALYDELAKLSPLLLAQEWISGGEGDHFTCNAYFDRDGQPLVTFVTRKIRQWPPQTGAGSLAVEAENEIVREEAVRLFSGVGFWGLGYLEMKREPETGRHLIIEPNVGRPTGRSAAAEAAGVEILYTMYCDVLGQPLPADRVQRYTGMKWIYFGRDVRSAFHYWRRGELSVREWLASLRGPKVDAVFSWRDPLPFWFDMFRVVGFLRPGGRS